MNTYRTFAAVVLGVQLFAAAAVADELSATRDSVVALLNDENLQQREWLQRLAWAERQRGFVDEQRDKVRADRRKPKGGSAYDFVRTAVDPQKELQRMESSLKEAEARCLAPPVPLPRIQLASAQRGEVGQLYAGDALQTGAQVFQVVDANNVIVELGGSLLVWLTDFPTADLTDGSGVNWGEASWEVVGTKQYETAIGGAKQVLQLRPFDLDPMVREAEEAWLERQFRTWSDASGKFSVDARIVGYERMRAKLVTDDGREIEVRAKQLSEDDQKFIRRWSIEQRIYREEAEKLAKELWP